MGEINNHTNLYKQFFTIVSDSIFLKDLTNKLLKEKDQNKDYQYQILNIIDNLK